MVNIHKDFRYKDVEFSDVLSQLKLIVKLIFYFNYINCSQKYLYNLSSLFNNIY